MVTRRTDLLENSGVAQQKAPGYLDIHGTRLGRLSDCKRRSKAMGQYLTDLVPLAGLDESRNIARLAVELGWCANQLVFHNYYTIEQVKLAKMYTCKKDKLCPFCARIRAAKALKKNLEKFNAVREEHPDLIPALLTLTVKNGPDLDERFAHLKNSWKTLQNRRRSFLKTGRGFNELCKVAGGVFSYETTKNKETGDWHPHLHVVVMLDSYIDQEKLSQEWKSITGDSMVVDIRRLRGDSQEKMAEAFCEVFKYALKFSELSLEDNFHASEAMVGRLQGSFGCMRGVKLPEVGADDLTDLDNLPYIEMFYRYTEKGYTLGETQLVEPESEHPQPGKAKPRSCPEGATEMRQHDYGRPEAGAMGYSIEHHACAPLVSQTITAACAPTG